MFLKIDPDASRMGGQNDAKTSRVGGSMILRMTAWYAGSSFLLILIATSFLYWTVSANMKSEDRHVLSNTAANLQYLVHASAGTATARHLLASPTGPFARAQLIWIRVIGADGRTRLETRGMDHVVPIADFPALLAIPPGRRVMRTIQTRGGQLFQTLSTRVAGAGGGSRIFQVAIDRTDEQRLLVHYRERLLFVLLLSLAFCSAIGYAIARSGMRPVERIIETARTIRSSTLHERLDVAGLPTELQSLAGTFNDMLDRLEESFAQVSRFSADVAHELRMPINNLRGEIEVALGRSRSPADYREVLGSALEECGRINRVIQSLLFLARAETAGEHPHFETLDVSAEIAAILEFYEPAAVDAGITLVSCPRSSSPFATDVGDKQATENKELVSCPRSSSPFATDVGDKQATENKGLVYRFRTNSAPTDFEIGTLAAETAGPIRAVFDRTLLQQAIGNLVANAIAHTPRGGTVGVGVRQDESAGLHIEVFDTGRGIPAMDLPHVFDRFYRADPARSSKGGNFGLGLSVVRSIAALHGGTVSIDSEMGRGTRAILSIPSRGYEQAGRPQMPT